VKNLEILKVGNRNGGPVVAKRLYDMLHAE
jgi:hypothetical protein